MPKIKRILDGKEYEIELTLAEIAAVCEYAEHEAAESLIKETISERLNEAIDDGDYITSKGLSDLQSFISEPENLYDMAEDFLERKHYGNCSENETLNEVIERYTEV